MAEVGLLVPDHVLTGDRGPGWESWRARLPRLVADVLAEWELEVDGTVRVGRNALVMPVLDADGRVGALKAGWPHPEAEHEHLALRAWAGHGAVQLLRADPGRSVLLLERGDADRGLSTLPAVEACAVVGSLYHSLHRPALPQLVRLSASCRDWIVRLGRIEHDPQVPRRFVVQALAHLRDLVDDPLTDGMLLHGDLHDANVLGNLRAGRGREPWLVIDPKPLSGDPAYEVAPLLWNRLDELDGRTVRESVVERFYAAVDAAGLDEERARAWVVVRAVLNMLWEVEGAATGRAVDPAWMTTQATVVKAVQR